LRVCSSECMSPRADTSAEGRSGGRLDRYLERSDLRSAKDLEVDVRALCSWGDLERKDFCNAAMETNTSLV